MVTDASGTFNQITRDSAWQRELHRDWRNDVEGLATILSNHIPDYRNLMTSYASLTSEH